MSIRRVVPAEEAELANRAGRGRPEVERGALEESLEREEAAQGNADCSQYFNEDTCRRGKLRPNPSNGKANRWSRRADSNR